MITTEQENVLQSAIDLFGVEKQLEMVVEECVELIQAIQKYKRNPSVQVLAHKLLQETADVDILIRQIRMIFGNETVDLWINLKIERLQRRVILNDFNAI